jgi:hypothetical protein
MPRRSYAVRYVKTQAGEQRVTEQNVVYASSDAEAMEVAKGWFKHHDGGTIMVEEMPAEFVGVPDDEELRRRAEDMERNDAFGKDVPDWMRNVGGV